MRFHHWLAVMNLAAHGKYWIDEVSQSLIEPFHRGVLISDEQIDFPHSALPEPCFAGPDGGRAVTLPLKPRRHGYIVERAAMSVVTDHIAAVTA